jgi:hypothetical protein
MREAAANRRKAREKAELGSGNRLNDSLQKYTTYPEFGASILFIIQWRQTWELDRQGPFRRIYCDFYPNTIRKG